MRRPLSVGDAMAVLVLVAFALIWIVGFGWMAEKRLTVEEFDLFWLCIWVGPPGFAGWLVYRIIIDN